MHEIIWFGVALDPYNFLNKMHAFEIADVKLHVPNQ